MLNCVWGGASHGHTLSGHFHGNWGPKSWELELCSQSLHLLLHWWTRVTVEHHKETKWHFRRPCLHLGPVRQLEWLQQHDLDTTTTLSRYQHLHIDQWCRVHDLPVWPKLDLDWVHLTKQILRPIEYSVGFRRRGKQTQGLSKFGKEEVKLGGLACAVSLVQWKQWLWQNVILRFQKFD